MCGSFWTYLKISQILRKICFPHCTGNTVGKLLECFSKIVYRFENCLGFVIASVVCLFVSSRFSKFNKHFAEEQNNWSHTCGFPDLFYMCMQYSVTQNMFKPSASNYLWCCGWDQSRNMAPDHITHGAFWPELLEGHILALVTYVAHHGPQLEAAVTGLHRGLRTQSRSVSAGGFAWFGSSSHWRMPVVAVASSAQFPSPGQTPAPQGAGKQALSWVHCKAGKDCIVSFPALSLSSRTFSPLHPPWNIQAHDSLKGC